MPTSKEMAKTDYTRFIPGENSEDKDLKNMEKSVYDAGLNSLGYDNDNDYKLDDDNKQSGNQSTQSDNEPNAEQEQEKDITEIFEERPDDFESEVIKARKDDGSSVTEGLIHYFFPYMIEFMNDKIMDYGGLEKIKSEIENKSTLDFLNLEKDNNYEDEEDNDYELEEIIPELLPFNIDNFKKHGWNLFKCFWIWYGDFLYNFYTDYKVESKFKDIEYNKKTENAKGIVSAFEKNIGIKGR